MGLVDRVVPDAEIAARGADDARRIAAGAPLRVRAIKAVADETVTGPAARGLEMCQAQVDRCFQSRDDVEGRRAFVEKREPVFTGSGTPPPPAGPVDGGDRAAPRRAVSALSRQTGPGRISK